MIYIISLEIEILFAEYLLAKEYIKCFSYSFARILLKLELRICIKGKEREKGKK